MKKFIRWTACAATVFALVVLGRGVPVVPPALAATIHNKPSNYDLTDLEVLSKVVISVKDNYVDPKRIDPKEMFVSALRAVEKQAVEVMVAGETKDGHVKLTVGNASRDIDFHDLDNIWQIPLKMRDVFGFIKENLTSPLDDPREVEYAAVNGMLGTLDPHSWLLKPDVYKEMKLQTRGEFGGLGFVIRMREDKLTVEKVLKGTPAQKGGVKKHDHIVRIEDESTVNLDLNEAVGRLRGKPGSKVAIWISRGNAEPKRFDLTRAVITIDSVNSKLMENGVGLVKVSSFSGTTTRELQAAIGEMREKNGGSLKGLVLDLRHNPGGLLEEAIHVVDTFVKEGTIVTTVGVGDKLREPNMAHDDGGELDFPMVVLVDSESASASEIVSGALKNLNRALIVGRQTFGKGSVQVLYDFRERGSGDESALKLTIKQYLTPGDVSIQSLGITPDIELVPSRVTKNRVDLFAPVKLMREEDLDNHFGLNFAEVSKDVKATPTEKPSESLRYLRDDNDKLDAKEKKLEVESEEEVAAAEDDEVDSDELVEDYEVKFCRDLVLRAPALDRLKQLEESRPFIAERRTSEEGKIQQAIEKLGVNWQAGTAGVAHVTAEVKTPRTTTGDTMQFSITATNAGPATVGRLHAYTTSENPMLDRREFIFGKLGPGEHRTWMVPVRMPKYLPSRRDDVQIHFAEAQNRAPDDIRTEVDTVELARPSFAFNWQVLDGPQGDGMIERGETVHVQVDVKNVGSGKFARTYASVKNLGDDKVFIKRGLSRLGELKPGETKTATFTIEVRKALEGDKVPLQIEVGDRAVLEIEDEKIDLPVLKTETPVAPVAATFKTTADAPIYAGADVRMPRLGLAKRGTLLTGKAKVGDFIRVEWTKGRIGYVAASAATEAAGHSTAKVSELFARVPPTVKISVDTSRGAAEVDADHVTLTGVASDLAGLRDLRIFEQHERENDARKVFFKTSQKVEGAAKPMEFSAELPLKPGNNTVVITAREDDQFATQRTLVIHRRSAALVQRGHAGQNEPTEAPKGTP